MRKYIKPNKHGFTLTELIVIIVICAIITVAVIAVLLRTYNNMPWDMLG